MLKRPLRDDFCMACEGQPVAIHRLIGARDPVLAVALGEGLLEFRSAETGTLHCRVAAHADGLLAAARSPNERFIATGGMDGFVRLWSASGELLHQARLPGWVDQLAFVTNDHLLAGGGRTLAVVRGSSCEMVKLPSAILALDVGPDEAGVPLALVARGNFVSLLDPNSLEDRDELPLRTQIRRAVISRAGGVAALAGQDTHLRIMRLRDRQAGPLSGYVRTPKSLSFSPDGVLLATSGLDLGVVWILRDGTAQNAEPILFAHDGTPTTSVCFHPTHPRLLMATQAGGLFMVDAAAEDASLHASQIEGEVSTLAWSEECIVVGTRKGQLLAFRAES
jgi:WD40 repeat protein